MSIEILYESESYIVVNKPCDMFINSDDENEKNTVACQIGTADCHRSGSVAPRHFVQRLDFATGGALCVAKSRAAAAAAGRLLERRLASKYYLGVVRGHVSFACADVEFDIGDEPPSEVGWHRMVAVTQVVAAAARVLRPRAARTRLLRLETATRGGEPITVLLMKPITGRRHQLRVHGAAAGLPLLGDCTYGGERERDAHRMFLHAARVVLPLKDEPLDILTLEPFVSDLERGASWSSLEQMHPFRTREDFHAACHVIDNYDVQSDCFKRFKCS